METSEALKLKLNS